LNPRPQQAFSKEIFSLPKVTAMERKPTLQIPIRSALFLFAYSVAFVTSIEVVLRKKSLARSIYQENVFKLYSSDIFFIRCINDVTILILYKACQEVLTG
jgi:hypothetical protein